MNDSYVECLVKRKDSVIGLMLKWIFILLMAGFLVLAVFTGAFGSYIAAIVTGCAAYFFNFFSKVEYEYTYMDREITVDKILNRSRRKRVEVFKADRIEIMAPAESHRLDSYLNKKSKITDYSTGKKVQPDERYIFFYEGNRQVIISPSRELIRAVKTVIPRRIFTD